MGDDGSSQKGGSVKWPLVRLGLENSRELKYDSRIEGNSGSVLFLLFSPSPSLFYLILDSRSSLHLLSFPFIPKTSGHSFLPHRNHQSDRPFFQYPHIDPSTHLRSKGLITGSVSIPLVHSFTHHTHSHKHINHIRLYSLLIFELINQTTTLSLC
ncbi:hypothetical protein EYC84_001347 [Monilinia fructicola]|uniref:Uncharacterized protein n=1 Tax=Monilinia fructicola TaxID=38448 RepID=A0A5M9JS51_MONFR|nr:hypothetical protein EYC84_001347 [Monilinia fructicola]